MTMLSSYEGKYGCKWKSKLGCKVRRLVDIFEEVGVTTGAASEEESEKDVNETKFGRTGVNDCLIDYVFAVLPHRSFE